MNNFSLFSLIIKRISIFEGFILVKVLSDRITRLIKNSTRLAKESTG
jgi:hypothetical protein